MKKLLTIAFAAVTLASCNNSSQKNANHSPGKDSTAMTAEEREERNKQNALATLKAFDGETSVDEVFKFTDKNFKDYGTGEMPPTNYDSTRKGLQEWVNAIPDYKATDLTAVADGDHVMVYGTWTGTWKNNMMGMNATKKSFKVNDVDIFKFNDQGRIVEHRAVQPMAEVARQIGMKMPAQKKQ